MQHSTYEFCRLRLRRTWKEHEATERTEERRLRSLRVVLFQSRFHIPGPPSAKPAYPRKLGAIFSQSPSRSSRLGGSHSSIPNPKSKTSVSSAFSAVNSRTPNSAFEAGVGEADLPKPATDAAQSHRVQHATTNGTNSANEKWPAGDPRNPRYPWFPPPGPVPCPNLLTY